MSKSGAASADLIRDGLRLEKAGRPDKALALYREARRDQDDPAVLADSWRMEAYAHHGRCAWDEALAAARRSGELAREAGRDDLTAEALNAEAAVHLGRGAFGAAAPLFEAMLELSDDPRIRGLALQNLATIHGQQGELDDADRRLNAAFQEFDRAGYGWGKAHVLNNTVALAIERGDHAGAASTGAEAIRLARSVEDLDLLAIATLNLAEALAGLGDVDAALAHASTALGHFQASGNHWRRVACLRVLGDVTARRGDGATARAFWRLGLDMAREIGAERDVSLLEDRLARGPLGSPVSSPGGSLE